VTISAIIGIAFGVIGYFAISYALQMVGIFGQGLGIDAESREIYAQSHKVVHVFAAACGLAVGWFWHRRNWVLFPIAVAAIFLCGGYGIINMYGFTGANRMTVAAVKDARKSAAEREYQAAREAIQGQIKWGNSTAANEEGREKRRLLAYVDAKTKELAALKAPVATADTVISDPQASTLADLTGVSTMRWMLVIPLIMAILLFFAESFSFVVVGHMASTIVALFATYWATVRAADPAKKAASEPSKSGSGGSGSGEPWKPKVVHPEPEPAAARTKEAVSAEPASIPKAEPPKVSNVGSRVSTDAPTGKLTYEQFAEMIREDMLHGEPTLSTRALEARTGWSQTSVVRQQKKVRGKQQNSPVRRFPGNGGGFHPSANG
jgi:roadblock/LC7 domain-containing protein